MTKLQSGKFDIRSMMPQMVNFLNRCCDAYYNQPHKLVEDDVYDSLLSTLTNYEKQYPEFVLHSSPTRRVRHAVEPSRKVVRHIAPVLGLNKGYTQLELHEFVAKVSTYGGDIVVEPKLDGLTVSLIYCRGILIDCLTGGDGIEGESIYDNIRNLTDIPLRVPFDDTTDTGAYLYTVIKCELVCTKDNLVKSNAVRKTLGMKPYANTRGCATGIIRSFDVTPYIHTVKLHLVAFELVYAEHTNELKHATHHASMACLFKLGFRTTFDHGLKGPTALRISRQPTTPTEGICETVVRIITSVYDSLEISGRDEAEYSLDGIVIKADDITKWVAMGGTSIAPGYAWAYKFKPKAATTMVRDIVFDCNIKGEQTPLLIIEPVTFDNATTTRINMHNYSVLRNSDVRLGDTITVSRKGDTIVGFDGVINELRDNTSKPYVVSTMCACGGALVVKTKASGLALACEHGHKCGMVNLLRLQHWCSKDALNLPVTFTTQLNQHILENQLTIVDLYNDKLLTYLPTEAAKKKLQDHIHKDTLTYAIDPAYLLPRIIYGLGINGISKAKAERYATTNKTLQRFLEEPLVDSDTMLDKVRTFFEIVFDRQIFEFFKPV